MIISRLSLLFRIFLLSLRYLDKILLASLVILRGLSCEKFFLLVGCGNNKMAAARSKVIARCEIVSHVIILAPVMETMHCDGKPSRDGSRERCCAGITFSAFYFTFHIESRANV